jgi:5-methylcytosine-specific restriction endonuclease McrA
MGSKKRSGKTQGKMKKYKDSHPYCELCAHQLLKKPSEVVHHIDPVGQGGATPESELHDESNMIALCIECHNKVHPLDTIGETILKDAKDSYSYNVSLLEKFFN